MAWNGSNGASAPKQKPTNGARAVSKGALAGVIVVLGAAAALYFLMPASAPTPKASAPKEKNYQDDSVGKKSLIPTEVGGSNMTYDSFESDGVSVETSLATNTTASASEAEDEKRRHKTVIVKPVFDNPTDQAIAMLMSSDGITPAPPVPVGALSDEEFTKSLDTPIEILDTDSDWVREIKGRVIAVRAEIKERMNNGESFANIIAEHQNTEMDNFRFRREVMTELNDIVRSGDMELAERYISTANVYLRQLGAQEIKMPSASVQNKIRNAKIKGEQFQ